MHGYAEIESRATGCAGSGSVPLSMSPPPTKASRRRLSKRRGSPDSGSTNDTARAKSCSGWLKSPASRIGNKSGYISSLTIVYPRHSCVHAVDVCVR